MSRVVMTITLGRAAFENLTAVRSCARVASRVGHGDGRPQRPAYDDVMYLPAKRRASSQRGSKGGVGGTLAACDRLVPAGSGRPAAPAEAGRSIRGDGSASGPINRSGRPSRITVI